MARAHLSLAFTMLEIAHALACPQELAVAPV
jgi:hypothetical protein